MVKIASGESAMSTIMMMVIAAVVGVLLIALIGYIVTRYYEARYDRTYMTQDDRGFRRALEGKVVLWDFDEQVVRGPTAPPIWAGPKPGPTAGRCWRGG